MNLRRTIAEEREMIADANAEPNDGDEMEFEEL